MDHDRFPLLLNAEPSADAGTELIRFNSPVLPALIREAGDQAQRRFLEFFAADIRNPGTRGVYAHAVSRFCQWCEQRGVPAHHNAELYVDEYLEAAGIGDQQKGPIFRTVSREKTLSVRRMHRIDVLRMIKRRAALAGIATHIGCHTFRATGITCYLLGGGSLEHAQRIAAHESARTTKLYDRTGDTVSLDEIERIVI